MRGQAQYTKQLRHWLRCDGYVTDPETGHTRRRGGNSPAARRPDRRMPERSQNSDHIQRAAAGDPALAVGERRS
jgi:hypothetical protein